MKQLTLFALLLLSVKLSAFCGFYVAKADAKLFNKASQVILVRNGNKTTVTMSSDFEGDVKDFAIVVPVPVVLKKEQVKVVDAALFKSLDDYSGPRVVSYNDEDPCSPPYVVTVTGANFCCNGSATYTWAGTTGSSVIQTVKIEAKYSVGEYDILVLSATESSGLEQWLITNGYKIPEGAKEVLDPYVKSNLKFFVVKANTDEMKRLHTDKLRPIQISYDSPKYMLPIRLGMANAKTSQDMIVYAFSKIGRAEVTNYRTVETPTGQHVPLFVKDNFGKFYKDLFRRAFARKGKNAVFLEYAWNISGDISQFCDPCTGPPPLLQDLMTAGVDWVQQYHTGYSGEVFFTRLHVRYDRAHFPQDLMFQETPNKENYQARYVLTYPPNSKFDCEKANGYLVGLQKRRQEELNNLADLTGWDVSQYIDYPSEYNRYIKKSEKETGKSSEGSFFSFGDEGGNTATSLPLILLSMLSITSILFALTRKTKRPTS